MQVCYFLDVWEKTGKAKNSISYQTIISVTWFHHFGNLFKSHEWSDLFFLSWRMFRSIDMTIQMIDVFITPVPLRIFSSFPQEGTARGLLHLILKKDPSETQSTFEA